MLYCHAEELDNNEHAEVNRVLEFMGIAPQAHAPKKVVTATVSLLSTSSSVSSSTSMLGSKIHDRRRKLLEALCVLKQTCFLDHL